MDSADALFEMISSARHCTALTGAGVSTLSGIRDFRGKNGLYTEMDAEKIFDINYFMKDPSFYYKSARDFIYNVNEKAPSVVHRVLGQLEEKGFLKALITQNIDLLHQKGGSRRVIEIHGSPSVHYCLHCSDHSRVEELAARGGPAAERPSAVSEELRSFDEVAALVKAGELPKCSRCGAALKPAITFFGENLPYLALKAAEEEARKSDLMLILGTSLTVFPAAGLPNYTLRSGGRLVIVNNMETPLDRQAALHFDELGPVFDALEKKWS
jgi:NAD-dependent deacetylase